MSVQENHPHSTFAVLALGGGLILVAASMCALCAFLLVPFLQTQTGVATNTALFSIGAFALAYGGVLFFVGRGLRQDEMRDALRLPPPLVLAGAFFLVIAIGQSLLTVQIGAAYFFPPFHAIASLLVPLTVLAFAARRLGGVSLRSVLAQFVWGGLVTIGIALVLQLVIGAVMVLGAAVLVALLIGAERLQTFADALQFAAPEPQRFLELVATEPLLLLVLACAAIVYFVVLVPLLEEFLKAGGAALLMARRTRAHVSISKREALLWGLAAGAGFAFTENMFNSQNALASAEGVTSFWAGAMLLRSGTSLMHMVATATCAVGWYALWVDKNRVRFGLLLVAAALTHGVWNVGALLLASGAAVESFSQQSALLSAVLVSGILVFLALLCVGLSFWLLRLVLWAQTPSVESITTHNRTGLGGEQSQEF